MMLEPLCWPGPAMLQLVLTLVLLLAVQVPASQLEVPLLMTVTLAFKVDLIASTQS
jgi:hypothetical protein